MQHGQLARRFGVTVAVATLLVTSACSSDSASNTTTATTSAAISSAVPTTTAAAASTTAAAGTDSGSVTTDLRVPDAFTAVTVRPLSDPTFPFKGSDGKYHVAYDLELTNAAAVPATIDKLDVVDASSPTTVIDSYSGLRLVDPDCQIGDCSRLRILPHAPATTNEIGPQESRVLFIDFAFDSADQAPKAVMHHLYATAAENPGSKSPVPVDYLAALFDISAGTPRVIGPPVKGDRWVAVNGCCEPGFPHRTSMATFNGMLINSQRFAIDWKQLNETGAFYEGDKTKNESYVDYGSEIIAVADGTITSAVDKLDANVPGVLPANDPVLGPQITVETVDGNHIVEDIGGGAYAFYAHLQKGSLLVKPGDTVKKGQVIAKLGNTGNANVSHMHFHLMNGPSVLGSDGIPYVLDTFSYDGQVSLDNLVAADDYMTGSNYLSGQLPTPEPRTNELPMSLAIVNFPG
jgi:murein DD-endopeptidase MepM/ murein hydrolase activator NlpD